MDKITLLGFFFFSLFNIAFAQSLIVESVTGVGTQIDDEISVDHVNDNDVTTRWSAFSSTGSAHLSLALDCPHVLSSVQIYFHKGDQRTSKFVIALSNDGINFETVTDMLDSEKVTGFQSFALEGDPIAQYVRIIGFGNSINSWNAYEEIDIYGDPDCAEIEQPVANGALEQWLQANGKDLANTQGDEDGDGIINFLEFVLGSDPNQNSVALLPKVDIEKNLFRYTRRRDSVEETEQILQYSANLETWTNISIDADSEQSIVHLQELDDQLEIVEVDLPVSDQQLFVRLNVRDQREGKFTLQTGGTTSAGVFDADGNLLRTLWSNQEQTAGTYNTPTWDGLDDQGNDVSTRGDSITVIANNINVDWEGTIGNTSDTFATEDVHRQFQPYHDMIITGNDAYFSMDYTENWGSSIRVDLENPQKRVVVMPRLMIQQSTDRVASDGVRLYMAGRKSFELETTYVQAAEFSDLNNFNEYLPFQGETLQIYGTTFNVADVVTDERPSITNQQGRARVTGLAVQQSGDWLFVARMNLNSVHVVHKIHGTLAQSYTFTKPKLTKIDSNGYLWMVHNETVEKFTINSNTGEISSAGLVIDGFTDIQGMDISPNGATIAIADAASSHRVFGHSTATGARQWTLGRNESYETNSRVYNDKFLFRSKHDELYRNNVLSDDRLSFITYESDGSFWVGDRGNMRSLKFAANRAYEDQIMWLPAIYAVNVDPNMPNRVFAGYLEFDVDYSLPLEAGNANQAWRFVNNWSEGIEVGRSSSNGTDRLENVTTLSNGRTYFLARNVPVTEAATEWEIFELGDQGTIRETGVTVDNPRSRTELKADGKITWETLDFINGIPISTLYERRITGFDSLGNPILGETEEFAQFEAPDRLYTNGARTVTGEMTASGKWVIFNGSTYDASAPRSRWVPDPNNPSELVPPLYDGPHLGGIKRGASELSFKTAQGIEYQRGDPFPLNGEFDARRFGQSYGGSVALAADDIIVWGYYGEFWESTQTNKWNMVSEEGLFLKQFGVADRSIFGLSVAGMAGNAFSPALIKTGSDMYLWHNDESYHGGVSRWKISNLSSIKKFNLKLK